MLDSPGGDCDVFWLLGEELSQPGRLSLQAVVVVAAHSQDELPRPEVRAPTPHHKPHLVLLTSRQTSYQLELQHRLGVPGKPGVQVSTHTPLS